jgi:hypothetical protein
MQVAGESIAWGCGLIFLLVVLVLGGWSAMQVADCDRSCGALPGFLLSEKDDLCYCEGEGGILFPLEPPR